MVLVTALSDMERILDTLTKATRMSSTEKSCVWEELKLVLLALVSRVLTHQCKVGLPMEVPRLMPSGQEDTTAKSCNCVGVVDKARNTGMTWLHLNNCVQ